MLAIYTSVFTVINIPALYNVVVRSARPPTIPEPWEKASLIHSNQKSLSACRLAS